MSGSMLGTSCSLALGYLPKPYEFRMRKPTCRPMETDWLVSNHKI